MRDDIVIRRATSSDVDAIYAVEVAAFAEDVWSHETFDELLRESECYYFIAYCDDKVVGYCGMYHETEETLQLSH